MTNKFAKGILILGLALILIISGCGNSGSQPVAKATDSTNTASPSPTAEKPLKKISVATGGGGPTFSQAPLYLAQDKDIWKKYGLEVNLLQFSGPEASTALISNSVQFAVSGGAIVSAAVASKDVKIIGTYGKYAFSLYSKEPLKFEELKGKTVGVIDGAGANAIVLKSAIKTLGLEPGKDVKLLFTGGNPATLAALNAGKIDAGVFSPPITSKAKEMGLNPVVNLYEIKGTAGNYGMLAVNEKFATKEPETVQAFMNAFAAASKLAKSDKETTKAILGKYTKITDDKTLEESYNISRDLWPSDLHLPESEIQVILDQLVLDGKSDEAKSKKPADLMDNRFADALK